MSYRNQFTAAWNALNQQSGRHSWFVFHGPCHVRHLAALARRWPPPPTPARQSRRGGPGAPHAPPTSCSDARDADAGRSPFVFGRRPAGRAAPKFYVTPRGRSPAPRSQGAFLGGLARWVQVSARSCTFRVARPDAGRARALPGASTRSGAVARGKGCGGEAASCAPAFKVAALRRSQGREMSRLFRRNCPPL